MLPTLKVDDTDGVQSTASLALIEALLGKANEVASS